VCKSADGGTSWQTTGLIRANISVLAIDSSTPTTLYAGTDSGVVKSTDGGASWHATTLTYNISSLAINPLTPTTIYAGRAWDISGQAWSGLFESTDGGGSSGELLDSFVPFLAIDPVTPTTLYGAGYSGVIKTSDGGANWATPTWNSFTGAILALAVDPVTRTTVYAGTDVICCDEYSGAVLAPGGIFKSTDGGTTWQTLVLFDVLTAFALAINPLTTTTVVLTWLRVDSSRGVSPLTTTFSVPVASRRVSVRLISAPTFTTTFF